MFIFLFIEIYLLIGLFMVIKSYMMSDTVKEKIDNVLKTHNIFNVILGMTIVILLTPIVILVGLITKK